MKNLCSICAGLVALAGFGSGKLVADDFPATAAPVGHAGGALITPANQLVTPAGALIELPGLRPQVLALSPDGKLLVTAGLTHELVVLEPATGKILQRVPLPPDAVGRQKPVTSLILNPDDKAQVSFTGLAFSPDGSRIFLSNVNGDVKVFSVARNQSVAPLSAFPLPPATAPSRKEEIPAGLAVSADGKKIYVALNLSNRLLELEAATGKILRTWEVGVAPFDVVLAGHKAYVSNWGRASPGSRQRHRPGGAGHARARGCAEHRQRRFGDGH